jgi:hypothetical protein
MGNVGILFARYRFNLVLSSEILRLSLALIILKRENFNENKQNNNNNIDNEESRRKKKLFESNLCFLNC